MGWKKDITEQFNILEQEFENGIKDFNNKINDIIEYFETESTSIPLSFSPINISENSNFTSLQLKLYFIYGLWFISLEEEKELKKRAGKGTLGQYSFYN